MSLLQLIYVHHPLVAELLEVETVGLVEVSGNRLRVVVDHDRPVAHLAELARTCDSTPVELDTTANAIYAGPEDHRTMLVEVDVVFRCVVCGVQVVRVSGILGGKSVDTFDEGRDAEGLALCTDGVFFG